MGPGSSAGAATPAASSEHAGFPANWQVTRSTASNTTVQLDNYIGNYTDNYTRHHRPKLYKLRINKIVPTYIPENHKSRYNRSLRKRADDVIASQKYVTNLSSRKLTETETKVLSKGLTFVPSNKMHTPNLLDAFALFKRSNRLTYRFRDQATPKPHPFRRKSTWNPPRASKEIEDYLQRVEGSIEDLTPKRFNPNMTAEERHTLHKLATDQTLVIKSADKGSGIVVEDTDGYVRDGLDHLSDKTIYQQIDSDPTLHLTEAIDTYVSTMHKRGIIDETTRKYLTFEKGETPRTQQLYFLKKIHKNPIAVRLIVSGCGGPTEKISQLVDLHIQPFVPQMESHIKNTGHLINILEKLKLPRNCTLATIDVKALYLNIPHKEGIQAIKDRIYTNNPKAEEVPIPPGTMSDLLNIVLTRNYFQFADKMFHQVQGTAMGTKMAPAYANIFMASLEEKLLRDHPTTPILWKRYIDDVLCIWPDSPESLKDFVKYLNGKHPTIKFTFECSESSVDFLDITIYKGERFDNTRTLDVKPFFKKTNTWNTPPPIPETYLGAWSKGN